MYGDTPPAEILVLAEIWASVGAHVTLDSTFRGIYINSITQHFFKPGYHQHIY